MGAILKKVEKGEDVILKRRGKKIARLVTVGWDQVLPSLKEFRASIKVSGSLSSTVIQTRDEERY